MHLLLLALVQGLTEFLPVSSSGHLVLLPQLTGAKDQGILIDVALHIGTLLAILLYYRRDLFAIACGFLAPAAQRDPAARRLGIYILLASLPAVAAGAAISLLFGDGIRSVAVITATTLVFGLLMGWADVTGAQDKTVQDMTLKQALLIGCAQALALIPGTSRSGVTMTAARAMGFGRVEAARFSFLLGIPAMAGAGALSLVELLQTGNEGLMVSALIAVGLSFIVGLGAIHFMMRWLRHAGLMPFVIYRMFLGGFLLVYFWPFAGG